MHVSMNWLMICLPIMVCLIQNNSAEPEASQKECRKLRTYPFDAQMIPKLRQKWYVARAVQRNQPPNNLPEPTMNNCTPNTFFESCKGGIYVEREWSDDGNVNKMTKAYSAQYDTIAIYHEEQTRIDPNFFIWQSVGKSMKIHPREGDEQEIKLSDVPVVEYALGRQYALIDYGYTTDGGKILWVLYQDCEDDIVWIEVAQFVLSDQAILDDVNARMDEYLQIPPPLPPMVKLETKLPFEC